ncbi:hypothetical protein ACPUYX_00530 [Desulfosporosinus sp. SYSU MS00001]|uniref:hypothetical protein n=1 Tax=Desulfosporosinus sp. SYSU MS00001 TaxID=3416284 RepID=UPI003CE696EB
MMKKLIPILVVVFMLMGAQAALGDTSITLNTKAVAIPNVYQTISGGQCTIVNNGDGTINISGWTSTYSAVTQIGLQLNLQYLSGGQWYTLNTYSYYKPNASYVYGGQLLAVSKGYYYRVVAKHSSLNGSLSESGLSYSEDLYVQ